MTRTQLIRRRSASTTLTPEDDAVAIQRLVEDIYQTESRRVFATLIRLLGDSSKPLFVLCALVILSFYGGGFATVPAYLKDLFGTYEVGAIHGRLLTAWSTAGVLGPLIVNWVADRQEEAGRHGPSLYGTSLVIMIGLLVVGFVANELVRPVHPRHHVPGPEAAKETADDRREQPESA